MESKQQQAVPKFEWDFDVPDTPFWKGIDMRIARNFITCYEPDKLERIPFDEKSSLPEPDKLTFLLNELKSNLAAQQAAAAPEKLHQTNPVAWRRLLLGIETMYKYLDMPKEEAETIRIMLSATEGDARVPWLNMLADLEVRNGNFTEAEALAREVLPWMQTHEKLGRDSPQAMGTTRTLIKSMWKQGGKKTDEARRVVGETQVLIDNMGTSKFAKYQSEEKQMLRELVDVLEGENGAKGE
ncbi:hypothetical protein V8F33_006930 [Rhypophila sp. PSN 637]